jgi:DNA-binding SARP family transcriptional activator
MQDLAESGRIEDALEYGRRILRMDPMRECVQRQVMWLHVLNGHQGNAIRQYQDCARILQDELGVSPMPETRALYEFIAAKPPAGKDAAATSTATRADGELGRLRSFISELNSHRQSVFSALGRSGLS